MASNLTKKEYIKILNLYKIKIPGSIAKIKQEADKILSSKLCKCIKKLSPKYKSKAIGICSRSIFNSKGLTRGSFKCKTKKYVSYSKSKTLKSKTNI